MSKVVAIMPCRNSGWVLGLSARALLMWCDELVVLDHNSMDDTTGIMMDVQKEFPRRVIAMRRGDSVWAEMAHRNDLLCMAREHGATHVVTLDDDEVLSGNLLPDIRRIVEETPAGSILQLPWLQLRGGINRVHTSGLWAQQFASSAFVDDPVWHWKPQGADGYDHHHRHPMGRTIRPHKLLTHAQGGVMHLQMASDRRLRSKQALYLMIETLRWPGKRTPSELNKMYGPTVNATGEMSAVPAEWWAPYSHLMHHLHLDAEPWQEAEVHRLIAEHGRQKFAGLDLFGVV